MSACGTACNLVASPGDSGMCSRMRMIRVRPPPEFVAKRFSQVLSHRGVPPRFSLSSGPFVA
jgi:hypothetical protein